VARTREAREATSMHTRSARRFLPVSPNGARTGTSRTLICFFVVPSCALSPNLPRAQALETPRVAAVLVQDNEGGRIVAKYFDKVGLGDKVAQAEFEKKLFKKTAGRGAAGAARGPEADVAVIDGYTAVYRFGGDVTFIVAGDSEENELILVAVLDALVDSLSSLLKGMVEKRTVLHQLELLVLAIDELVEGGIPFELDAEAIEARVLLRGAVPDSISSYQEMTIGQLADKGRAALAKQFAK
jgi:coatomer subunit zeta